MNGLAGAIVLLLSLATLANAEEQCAKKEKRSGRCLVKLMQSSLPYLSKGIPKYGVFPMDPLYMENMGFTNPPGSTINVKHKFMKVNLSGLGSAQVKNVRLDPKNTRMEADVFMLEPVILIGLYESTGQMLALPIRGEGRFNITLVNQTATLTMRGHEVKKNGKTYVQLDWVRFPFKVDKLILDFENLFKGNKPISQMINRVLNENWEPVLDDMKGSFQEAIGNAFKEILNRIFSKVPITEIYKDYYRNYNSFNLKSVKINEKQ